MATRQKSFYARYTDEYLNRLAFSIAQFWPADEELPDQDAKDTLTFYDVSIRRLQPEERRTLLRKLRIMATHRSGFFVEDFRGTLEARAHMEGVIARFPLLRASEFGR